MQKIFEKQKKTYYRRQWADEWVESGLCIYATEFGYVDYISEYFASPSPRQIAIDTVNEIFRILSEKVVL